MLNLYIETMSFNNSYPIREYSRFDYIKRRYLEELTKIKEYYHNRDRAVNNRHILSKILHNIVPSIDLDDTEYLKHITANSIYYSKQYDFVSNIHSGNIVNSQFYGNNSKELLLYVTNSIDFYNIKHNWKNIESAKIVYTELTDLNFIIPDGTTNFRDEIFTVIEIDLITMAMQYKYWALERVYNDKSVNTNVFVSTIILPNMLDNLLDLTIFNRFKYMYYNGECKDFVIKHPFPVLDFSAGIDYILNDIINHDKNTSITVEQLINTIPTVVNKNMLQALHINMKFHTRQSYWSIWASRIDHMVFLLDILGKRGMARNIEYINILPVYIRALDNRVTDIKSKLTPTLYDRFKNNIDTIKNKIGKR